VSYVENKSVEEAWDKEVARRMADLKAGRAVTVPWEQLHRELLALVNKGQQTNGSIQHPASNPC